jgi:hypothetical protein
MKVAQIKIPKINSEDLKLYIYRSLNSDDINTISKVSNLEPIIIINQDAAITETIDDKEYYIVYDKPSSATGITYNGPQPNNVPVTEYEANINLVMLNSYTPVNELILEPLELKHMFDNNIYFSTKDGKYYTLNFIRNTISIEYNAGSGSITQDIIIHLYMLNDRLDDHRFKGTLEEVYQDDLRIFFQIRDAIKELLRYIHDQFRGLIANIEFREKAKEAGIEL